jgi:predicted nuclease of predicted toxin-antitoxin system
MRLVADEGLDRQIVDRLRADGHDVMYVAEQQRGVSDDAVLRLSLDEGRLLVTPDKDFGELIHRQRRTTAGVILVRLAGAAPDEKARLVAAAVAAHGAEMSGAFAVVSTRSVRIRSANLP